MNVFDPTYINIQARNKTLSSAIKRYYEELDRRDRIAILKTQDSQFMPYLSTVDQVCDFLFWFDGVDPMKIYSEVLKHRSKKSNDMLVAVKMALKYVATHKRSKSHNFKKAE